MKIEVILTGTRHYRGFPCLDVGGEVRIEFDEENEYSNNAFGVFTLGGLRIGSVAENPRYIPRVITSDITKLSPELKSLLNDGYTINKAVCTKIHNNLGVIEVILNEPSPIEEETTSEEVVSPMEDNNMIEWKSENGYGCITVVGCSHNNTDKNIGDEVHIVILNYEKVSDDRIKGTSTVFNQNGERVGVLPQSPNKLQTLEENNLPIYTNEENKAQYGGYECINEDTVFYITDISECGRYVRMDIIPPVVEETTKAEVVVEDNEVTNEVISLVTMLQSTNRGLLEVENIVEEETTDEVVVEATTEVDKEEDKMQINEILKGDEMLQHKVERRNELINKANDLKKELATIESGIEVLEGEISEIVEKHTLISQIKANLEVLDIDELRKVNNAIIDNSSSSDEEETTSSSSDNEEIVEEEVIEEVAEEEVEEKTIPQQQMCIHCDECKFSPNSGMKPNVCFYYEHWVDDVLKNKNSHFIEGDDVFKYTYGMGGFDNHRYTVELEDRTLMDVGLWSRGTVPSDMIRNALKKGIRK